MKALLKNIRISPDKANLVAGLVRGAMVNDALTQLKFTPKKGAKILYRVIDSAASNAEHNLKQNREKLYVKEVIVSKGVTYKRGVSVSRGRVHPILKRTSQIRVTVDVSTGAQTKKRVSKKKPARSVTPSNTQE